MKRILVSPRSVTKGGHPSLERLRAAGYEVVFTTPGVQPDETELLAKLPGCAGFLAGVEKISARVLEAAAATLRVIGRNGVGIDNVDLAAAERLGIKVLATGSANSRGVAELAVALILALARWIPPSDAAIKAGGWQRQQGVELEGKTLGLVGCGRIGRLVATMAAGLGMRTIGYDPIATTPQAGLEFVAFDALLAGADFVSLHCPAAADGRPVIGAAALSRMRKGAFLVNTARASLLDNAAVLAALNDGKLAGLATDVFDHEPPGEDPLARNPRVIATPHIGGFTRESVDRAVSHAVENILSVLEGR
ncbi:MAG: phosphoglycerate dehydrogenase [Phycisphaerae bacterium]|nr:phosphoglycerate dehydrogenase [Phycisphaerae bacterium]